MTETKKKEDAEGQEAAQASITTLKPVPDEAPPKPEADHAGKAGSVWKTVVGAAVKVAEASGEMVKSSAEKVGDLSARAAHLAKLKLEVRNLRHDLEKLYRETGEKLWRLHTEKALEGLTAPFEEDLEKIEGTVRDIEAREAEMDD